MGTFYRRAAWTLCVAFMSASAFAVDNAPAGNKKPIQDMSKTLLTDEAANAEVDAGFRQWSSTWMFDRYLAGSAHATERGFKDDTYVIRGLFDFVRSGSKITIPFAAAYTKGNDRHTLSNLCYNDYSSGMTDCINPNASLEDRRAAAMQSRQFLGSIVLLGMVAAMSEEETCVKRYTFFGEPYFLCE